MNVKEYIESGILEAYVLGALPEEERSGVEVMIARHPEIAAELDAIELAMRSFAEQNAEEPPVQMQEVIWGALEAETKLKGTDGQISMPKAEPKIIPFNRQEKGTQVRWQRAAVWIALAGSMLTNIMLWYQRDRATTSQQVLVTTIDSMHAQQQTLAGRIDMFEKERGMLLDTGMKTIVMRSTQPGKDMAGMIFWSKSKGDAYVALHNMPMPPQGKQYQLWVIQDGKPVDMGTIPNDMVAASGMQKINKLVASGQAFAISLEKEGGSPTPTMEQIFVLGAVSS